MRRVIIAGAGSGCGKTTVTCAVLEALCRREIKVSSFKCGPDYIDPMFHKKIIGTDSHNLDSFFCDENTLKYLLYENSRNSDIS
ncbi:MAG: cobyrinate a,c-diamide synthase, partial [Ruminococcus sp.]|nr:cobyrinate a,c-diamide synthase [Ruminococcus sp.]